MRKITEIDATTLKNILHPTEQKMPKHEGSSDHLTPQQRELIEKAAEEGICMDIFPRSESENQ